jgi:hypothetical protein
MMVYGNAQTATFDILRTWILFKNSTRFTSQIRYICIQLNAYEPIF